MSTSTDSISTEGLKFLYENAMKALDRAKAGVASAQDALEWAERQVGIDFVEAEKWSTLLDERERQAA